MLKQERVFSKNFEWPKPYHQENMNLKLNKKHVHNHNKRQKDGHYS